MSDRTQFGRAGRISAAGLRAQSGRYQIAGMAFLDKVIETRVPELYSSPVGRALLPLVYGFVNHRNIARLMHEWSVCPTGIEVIRHMHRMFQLRVETRGIDNVPASGGCLLVANHPTGLIDGIALFDSVRRIREDVTAFVFHDILAINPAAVDAFIPVEWRPSHQSMAKSRETFRVAHKAFKSNRLVTIFPSGRTSYWNGLRVGERPWKDTFLTFARRYGLPIVPVHIGSCNSLFYYCLSVLSPKLRDLQSINEIQNKTGHRFDVTFGKPVMPNELDGSAYTLTSCFQYYVEHVLPGNPGAAFTDLLNAPVSAA